MSNFWDTLTRAERQQFRDAHAEAKLRRAHGEPCPVCGVPMLTDDGLWYCDGCDAYHGEIDEPDQDSTEGEQGR